MIRWLLKSAMNIGGLLLIVISLLIKGIANGWRLDVLVDEPEVSPLAVQGPIDDQWLTFSVMKSGV